MQKFVGKICVVRGDRSGVFMGEVVSIDGQNVIIKNCRRLWYWEGAASLSQLALEGVKVPENCKFTVTVEELGIFDCIEIIPATKEAIENIAKIEVWKK